MALLVPFWTWLNDEFRANMERGGEVVGRIVSTFGNTANSVMGTAGEVSRRLIDGAGRVVDQSIGSASWHLQHLVQQGAYSANTVIAHTGFQSRLTMTTGGEVAERAVSAVGREARGVIHSTGEVMNEAVGRARSCSLFVFWLWVIMIVFVVPTGVFNAVHGVKAALDGRAFSPLGMFMGVARETYSDVVQLASGLAAQVSQHPWLAGFLAITAIMLFKADLWGIARHCLEAVRGANMHWQLQSGPQPQPQDARDRALPALGYQATAATPAALRAASTAARAKDARLVPVGFELYEAQGRGAVIKQRKLWANLARGTAPTIVEVAHGILYS